MNGPGKYDEYATVVREHTEADGVILIVIEGNQGSGFSVQSVTPGLNEKLPELLRHLANEIEQDLNVPSWRRERQK